MTIYTNLFTPSILLTILLALVAFTLAACGGGGTTQDPLATTHTITFVSSGNGTLNGAASQTIAHAGSTSAVIAVPAAGYHFVNWTEGGSEVGVNASITLTNVTTNQIYTANFAIDTVAKTTATFKINLTGTLPAGSAISGTTFSITLPANVTPDLTNGVVNTGVVSNSGTFAGSTLSPQVTYTAATPSAPGTFKVILTNSVPAGVTQVGEVATVILQLANSAAPAAGDFPLTAVSVIDAATYSTISGMGVNVAAVTLQ